MILLRRSERLGMPSGGSADRRPESNWGEKSSSSRRICLLVCIALVILQRSPRLAGQNPTPSSTSPQQTPTARDGQHDFDWELGTWKIHISRLQHPLTGSTEWVDLNGTVL